MGNDSFVPLSRKFNVFDQLLIDFTKARKSKEPKDQRAALKEASKKAITFEQWCLILDNSVVGSKLERIAFNKVLELAITSKQLKIIYEKINPWGCIKKHRKRRLEWRLLVSRKMAEIETPSN